MTAGKELEQSNGPARKDSTAEEQDPAMQRAQTLLELHQSVKVAYTPNTTSSAGPRPAAQELQQARRDVDRVLQTLVISSVSTMKSQQTQSSARQKPFPTTSAPAVEQDDEDVDAWS